MVRKARALLSLRALQSSFDVSLPIVSFALDQLRRGQAMA